MAWNPYGSYTQAAQGPDDSYGDLSYDAYREPETDSSGMRVTPALYPNKVDKATNSISQFGYSPGQTFPRGYGPVGLASPCSVLDCIKSDLGEPR